MNISYNEINQKRAIELINLNDVFKKQLNFSENQIKDYYENNKNIYTEIYKSIKLLELNPKNLVGDNEFTDLFFKKIGIAMKKINVILLSFLVLLTSSLFADGSNKWGLKKPSTHVASEFKKIDSNNEHGQKLSISFFGMQSVWPIVFGLISKKAIKLSSSRIL